MPQIPSTGKVDFQISPVVFFLLSTLNGTVKAPTVDLVRLNILRGIKTAFLSPKRYDEHLYPFCMGFTAPPPSPPPPPLVQASSP